MVVHSDIDNVLTGLILTGGKSRRLGRDKAAVDHGGRTLLARSVELARRFCLQVYVSVRDSKASATCGLDDCDLNWLPDETAGQGPIGGIATGLKRLKSPLLVLPCDLPLLSAALVERLVTARKHRPAMAVVTAFSQPVTSYLEPLVAVYEPEALELLRMACSRGVFALRAAIPAQRWHRVAYSEAESAAFLNINTPEDIERLSGQTGRAAASDWSDAESPKAWT